MERSYESASALVGRAAGPLSQHLTLYVDSLIRQQYVPAVVYVKAMHALSFDGWLARQRIALNNLAEVHASQFGRRRRRYRGCIRPETRHRERFDVLHVLRYLRAIGVCPDVPRVATPAINLAAAYEHHLRQRRGLADSSIARYGRVVQQFLAERFGDADVDLRVVRAVDVIDFVRRQAQRLRPPAAKCIVNAMRSFLRYAQFRGEVDARAGGGRALRGHVDHHAGLAQGDRAGACTARHRQLRPGHSARTARPGRAADPRAPGVARSRNHRAAARRLRLGPRPAARARQGRPRGTDADAGRCRARPSPHICERGRPRVRRPPSVPALDGADQGLQPGWRRHRLDRALRPQRVPTSTRPTGLAPVPPRAGRALPRGGASLREIGEVLRHRSPQSTSIYARVDLEALRPLALRWPGGAP